MNEPQSPQSLARLKVEIYGTRRASYKVKSSKWSAELMRSGLCAGLQGRSCSALSGAENEAGELPKHLSPFPPRAPKTAAVSSFVSQRVTLETGSLSPP